MLSTLQGTKNHFFKMCSRNALVSKKIENISITFFEEMDLAIFSLSMLVFKVHFNVVFMMALLNQQTFYLANFTDKMHFS